MKRVQLLVACLILTASGGALLLSRPLSAAEPPHATVAGSLDSGNGALFTAFVPVLRHPRCMNCHSMGDYPRQGDDSHPHTMNVRRGPVGFGVTAEKCSTCHQDHNLGGAHLPPGAPGWHLPPPSMPMIWQGLTDAQLCESIKDPKQNRNRNLDQLVEHLTEDKLVAWGWNPGVGRTPVPIPHDEFSAMVQKWQAAGAPCPAQ
ncbi:MAG: hypothetical protein ABR874_12925 [Candidatus Sulfotelmatobacter sp.]|jgi:hypothetical protein